MLKITLVLPLIVCTLSVVSAQTSFGRCFTPDEYRGDCIYFKSCQSLFELSKKKPQDNRDRLFITLSQCGFRDGQPLVCCKDVPPPPPPPTEPPTTPTSVPVSTKDIPTPGKCGIDFENRIYGGNRTEIDEYPWMALLGYSKPQNKKGFHCGGVLINHRYVLTASHCVNGKDIPQTWTLSHVRLGEWDTAQEVDCDDSFKNERVCSQPPIDVNIVERIPHPQYDPYNNNQFNDIAMLRLEHPIEYTEFIKPICLPIDPTLRGNDFIKQTLSVAGWGKTEKLSASNLKLKVNVDGVSNADCNRVYNNEQRQIIDTQVCAGGKKGQDSCRGDSGGPLMRQNERGNPPYWYLAGLVSYGPSPCGLENWPGVYTRVGKYIEWIEDTIQP
ncbi:serine protease easter-like [Chironomus tepperi]|uniref:serine protease easter-like n=1 Tax=Chironomus tepperi TaxID=113505 RepID=UPI00391EE887